MDMTKTEFLAKLARGLKKCGVEDTEEILAEYEEHFDFKLSDGFSQEEIAAKLGDPRELAAQFAGVKSGEKRGGRSFLTGLGLAFTDLFAFCCFALLWAWELVMAAATVAFGVLSVCLLLGLNLRFLIPQMPYGCALLYGVSFAALTVLSGCGSCYLALWLRQLMRAFARFHHNAMAAASGRPVLAPLPTCPLLSGRIRRVLRRVVLLSLCAFAIFAVLGMIVSMLQAHALQFWHVWGWFGYPG
jgi:uncharacterized membrane protein